MASWLLPKILIAAALFSSCGSANQELTVYCSLDQVYSEPILRDFEKETGIHVKPVFDIEANKTVGLVRTLIEEKNHPHCDVFWNNELAQTIKLKRAGILQIYKSPNAEGIPDEFRDREGYWNGFAARARVLIVNTDRVVESERPRSISGLVDPKWKQKVGIAKPVTGTTITHFSALFEKWGESRMKSFCEFLQNNEVRLTAGNAQVAKLVGKGELFWGLTDSDDFYVRVQEKEPVAAVYPDAEGDGTLLIPNSLCLIAGAPHPELGRKLIDWLLRPEIEERLAAGDSAQIPLRPGVKHPAHVKVPGEFRSMKVDWEKVADQLDQRSDFLRETFTR